MILNYSEASAYATAIGQYFLLIAMSCIVFIWAWENLVYYFTGWLEEEHHNDILDSLDEINASVQDVRNSVEDEQRLEINV